MAKLDGDQVLRLRGDDRCMPDRVVRMGGEGTHAPVKEMGEMPVG